MSHILDFACRLFKSLLNRNRDPFPTRAFGSENRPMHYGDHINGGIAAGLFTDAPVRAIVPTSTSLSFTCRQIPAPQQPQSLKPATLYINVHDMYPVEMQPRDRERDSRSKSPTLVYLFTCSLLPIVNSQLNMTVTPG